MTTLPEEVADWLSAEGIDVARYTAAVAAAMEHRHIRFCSLAITTDDSTTSSNAGGDAGQLIGAATTGM